MAPKSIDELLLLAAQSEREAYEFYSEVASRVDNEAVKKLFTELAEDEKGHEALMIKFRSDPERPIKFKESPNFKVAETVETPPLTTDMKPADAVALAMKKEQQAAELYTSMAGMCEDSSAKSAYENLAKMELSHKHRLENIYTDIAFVEVW